MLEVCPVIHESQCPRLPTTKHHTRQNPALANTNSFYAQSLRNLEESKKDQVTVHMKTVNIINGEPVKENKTVVANRYEVLGDYQESVTTEEKDTVQEEVHTVGRDLKASKIECEEGEISDEQSRSKEENKMALVEVGIEKTELVNTLSKYMYKESKMTHDGVAERIAEDEENKMVLVEVVKQDVIPLNTLAIYMRKDTNWLEDWKNSEKDMVVIDEKYGNTTTMNQGAEKGRNKKKKQSQKATNSRRSTKSKETGITQANRVVTRSDTNKAIYKC
ncbi:hypothetical protein HAX54_020251 [Datura stramonium]|uniref:Uncharacterized protein n=1 Tax=Datura stramonium TaxID=4076 RepID=A0ABS8USA9_DATST|nr:hypothetical protein [Datura stramonium]